MARKKKQKTILDNLAKELFKKNNPVFWVIGVILLVLSFYFNDFLLQLPDLSPRTEQQQSEPDFPIDLEGLSFNQAKSRLVQLYKDHPEQKEFYCGCDFSWEGKKGIVDLKSCGYKIRKNEERARRIEWEHVMPAYAFGNQLRCWQEGGRKACQNNAYFNVMEGDMHNLQPAVGEINGDRSNFRFSDFEKTFTQYGKCEFYTDFKNRQVQPRNEVKGMIARTYLYMEKRYQLDVADQEKKLMTVWNAEHPPKAWECKRNNIIQSIQGNDNEFITEKCR
ncbi:MAG: deoxyribonuclease [Xanthomonadaceae bacterium]|nr:deoxyribonuclease [Xanthomonadaceae bacterium]